MIVMSKYQVKDVRFLKGVVGEEAILYDGTPQVAFIGRSNVGKSTTMNVVMERKGMVKTGKTPGKTREINFFSVLVERGVGKEKNALSFYFVDLPGYGYAKLSKEMRKKLFERIFWYLTHPVSDLKLVVLLIDARRGLTPEDEEVLAMLKREGRKYLIAVNKIDKLKQRELALLKKELSQRFAPQELVFYSAIKKKHTNILQERIFDFLFENKEQEGGKEKTAW